MAKKQKTSSKAKQQQPAPIPNEKPVHRYMPQRMSATQWAAARNKPPGSANALRAFAGLGLRTDAEWRQLWTKLLNSPAT